MKCGRFFPGLQRFDLHMAPGVIQVIVPAFAGSGVSEWALVNLRRVRPDTTSDSLLVAREGSASFKSKNSFRGDYIGVAYGEYVVHLTVGDNPAAVASAAVTLSAEDGTAAVTLSIGGSR